MNIFSFKRIHGFKAKDHSASTSFPSGFWSQNASQPFGTFPGTSVSPWWRVQRCSWSWVLSSGAGFWSPVRTPEGGLYLDWKSFPPDILVKHWWFQKVLNYTCDFECAQGANSYFLLAPGLCDQCRVLTLKVLCDQCRVFTLGAIESFRSV